MFWVGVEDCGRAIWWRLLLLSVSVSYWLWVLSLCWCCWCCCRHSAATGSLEHTTLHWRKLYCTAEKGGKIV